MGECPEWQRELTVNQPPYGFVGSSPTSPTIRDQESGISYQDRDEAVWCHIPDD
jgi:hypothetical protein